MRGGMLGMGGMMMGMGGMAGNKAPQQIRGASACQSCLQSGTGVFSI
jgi:hypothetical protein